MRTAGTQGLIRRSGKGRPADRMLAHPRIAKPIWVSKAIMLFTRARQGARFDQNYP
jgi:hypothetical protein